MMKNHTKWLLLLLAAAIIQSAQAQRWRSLIEIDTVFTEVPFCNSVQNGLAQIPPTLTNSTDYRTRIIAEDTIFVDNDFALEVRMRNSEANGGITAFDPGIYLDGCSLNAGASLMGASWALDFTSIYAGTDFQTALPAFVRDFSDWRIIRYVFKNNVFRVFDGNELLHTFPYNGRLDFIYRLTVRFKGSGLMDWIKLYNGNGQEIWREEFLDCNAMQPFPDWQLQKGLSLSADTLVCRGVRIVLNAQANIPATFRWITPAGRQFSQPTLLLSEVTAADTGYYRIVTTFAGCLSKEDSVRVEFISVEIPPANFLGRDTTLCPGASLTLGRSYSCAAYRWSNGSTAPTFTVQNPGVYWLEIEIDGQRYRDSIQVEYFMLPTVELGNDTTLCPENTLTLNATIPNAIRYRWPDGSAAPTFTIAQSGTYFVEITDVCGNRATDSIRVNYFPILRRLNLGDDVRLCPGDTLLLNAADSAAIAYRWQDSSTGTSFTVRTPGMYAVTVTDNCRNLLSDSIRVDYFAIIQSVNLGNDTTLCPGNILEFDVTNAAAARYQWQDGSTTPFFTVQQPGVYRVSISDNCGNTITDEIRVAYFNVLRPLELGRDTSICPGALLRLNATDPAAVSYLWQDGSARPEYEVLTPGIYKVSLKDNCGNVETDSIQVTLYQMITNVDLGADFILCAGESKLLDVTTSAAARYRWQDGSTKSNFLVDRPGIYSVLVEDNCGNSATDEVRVRLETIPEATQLGSDTTVCEGGVYRLNAAANNAIFYRWQDGSDAPSYPVVKPGVYTVSLGNACGSNTYRIAVDFTYCGPCRTGVPNAFSPNGDNINDQLEVLTECIFTRYDFRVFDRWGVQVFASQNPNEQWDGTFRGVKLPLGVYIWRLTYEADDGSTDTLAGDCTLMR